MKAAWIFEECDAVLRQVAKNLSSYATGYKLFEVCFIGQTMLFNWSGFAA